MDRDHLGYICWVLESLSRRLKKTKKDLIVLFGNEGLKYLEEFYDILHCENQDKILDELSEDYKLGTLGDGAYPNSHPTISEIASVYARLIEDCYPNDFQKGLREIFSSFLSELIDDYNQPVYWASSSYLAESYKAGYLL